MKIYQTKVITMIYFMYYTLFYLILLSCSLLGVLAWGTVTTVALILIVIKHFLQVRRGCRCNCRCNGRRSVPEDLEENSGNHKPRPLLDKGEILRPLHCTHHPHKPRPPNRWHQLRIQLLKLSSLPHHLILPWTLISQLQLLSTNVMMKMFLITPGLRPNRKKDWIQKW